MNELASLKRDVYAVRTEGDGFRVTKFNPDLTPVSFYHLNAAHDGTPQCDCPQSRRGPCKHVDILEAFTELYPERVNQGWFYCAETSDWFPPVADAATEDTGAEAAAEPPKPAVVPEVEQPVAPSGTFDRRGL